MAPARRPDTPRPKFRSPATSRRTARLSRPRCQTAVGRASPNHTTPGRSMPPHSQRGGISGSGERRSSCSRPHSRHRNIQMLPCTRSTLRLPASSCSPSTFCVISVNWRVRCFEFSQRVMARVGLDFRDQNAAAPVVPFPNQFRIAREGLGRCEISARCCFHRPSAPRNVGTPLSAETPAPVSTATERACSAIREPQALFQSTSEACCSRRELEPLSGMGR